MIDSDTVCVGPNGLPVLVPEHRDVEAIIQIVYDGRPRDGTPYRWALCARHHMRPCPHGCTLVRPYDKPAEGLELAFILAQANGHEKKKATPRPLDEWLEASGGD
jgi:hypothetical protein